MSRDVDPPLLPAHERPRERLLVHGASALSNAELVTLVLGTGRTTPAEQLLEALGGMRGLATAWPQELARLRGIGPARAAALSAAMELGRRVGGCGLAWAQPLRRPADVAEFVRQRLQGAVQEHFLAIGLDARQRVRLVRTVAIGSLAQVDVHPRELFRPLVRAGMFACVLAHNHPSGACEPSNADVELTHRMCEAGRLLGVPVLDHVVVTDEDSVSLAALGLLPG